MKSCQLLKSILFICFVQLVLCSNAQWVSQDISIPKGWSAVYVRLDPAPPSSCRELFQDTPVKKVCLWRGNAKITNIDINNPSKTYVGDDWYFWDSGLVTNDVETTLRNIEGDHTYLVYSEDKYDLSLKGHPCVPCNTWLGSSYNLVGFQVDPVDNRRSSESSYLTFEDWFSDEDAIECSHRETEVIYAITSDPENTKDIYELDITPYVNNKSFAVNPAMAYWVYARSHSDFTGDISVKPALGVVDFGSSLNESMVTLENHRSSDNYVTVRYRESDPHPETGEVAPRVPLMYFKNALDDYGWHAFPDEGINLSLSGGKQYSLRIAVDRTRMNAADDKGEGWAGIIQYGGAYGSLIDMGVHAEFSSDLSAVLWPDGLWYGDVVFTECTRIPSMTNQAALAPVSYPLKGALILHISESADVKATLMQRALLVHGEADDSGKVDYILYDKEKNLPSGLNVTKFSSVLFGFRNSIGADPESIPLKKVSFDWTVGADDVDNPFKHPYHPAHDGLNADFSGPSLTEEIFAVQHHLELEWDLSELDMAEHRASLWQPSETLEGCCTMTLKNLRKNPISLRGRFELRRIAPVGAVNK